MEQMEKLNATLRGIETLTSVARDTATKLTQLSTEENSKQLATVSTLDRGLQLVETL